MSEYHIQLVIAVTVGFTGVWVLMLLARRISKSWEKPWINIKELSKRKYRIRLLAVYLAKICIAVSALAIGFILPYSYSWISILMFVTAAFFWHILVPVPSDRSLTNDNGEQRSELLVLRRVKTATLPEELYIPKKQLDSRSNPSGYVESLKLGMKGTILSVVIFTTLLFFWRHFERTDTFDVPVVTTWVVTTWTVGMIAWWGVILRNRHR